MNLYEAKHLSAEPLRLSRRMPQRARPNKIAALCRSRGRSLKPLSVCGENGIACRFRRIPVKIQDSLNIGDADMSADRKHEATNDQS